MQFLIVALDGKDTDAQNRRMMARPDHIKLGDDLLADGSYWYGAALRNDQDQMIGSMLMMDFKNCDELDQWLQKEPYVQQGVWKDIQIYPCSTRDPWQFNRPKEFFEKRTGSQN